MSSNGQSKIAETSFIEYDDAYPVLITKDISASKAFYQRWLDFEIAFEASWFVFMQSKGDKKISFALIAETHPSDPPSYSAFDGNGSFLTLQVKDVATIYKKLKSMKAPISYELKKEDWGQLRFGLTDPNGMYIDIVQQIAPIEGFWEKYPVNK